MPASARRGLGAVVAAVGIILFVVGAWVVVQLGPSGRAQFSATSKAPGAIVIPPDVLNAVDVPVRVTATRGDGGAVLLAAAPSSDARAILAGSAVSTVNAVRFPAGRLGLRASGAGALSDIGTADVWRLSALKAGSAAVTVDQGRGPEAAVVASGDTTALTDVTVTLTWASQVWFFEALLVAIVGGVLAAFALSDLWQNRVIPVAGHRAEIATTEAIK